MKIEETNIGLLKKIDPTVEVAYLDLINFFDIDSTDPIMYLLGQDLIDITCHDCQSKEVMVKFEITGRGKKILMKSEYPIHYRNFKKQAIAAGYNHHLMEEYIAACAHELSVLDMLNIENFKKYCVSELTSHIK